MKKINSIGYGHKILLSAVICLIVVPLVSYFIGKATNLALFHLLAKVSLILGVLIASFFFVLLKVELHQDKKMNDYYRSRSRYLLPLENGFYECQTCGNNQVKPGQKSCIVCGTSFINRNEDGGNKQESTPNRSGDRRERNR